MQHVWNECGCLVVRCGLGLARKEMQAAIHALRAEVDSAVKYDGVADCSASLSLPWLVASAARNPDESLNLPAADLPV